MRAFEWKPGLTVALPRHINVTEFTSMKTSLTNQISFVIFIQDVAPWKERHGVYVVLPGKLSKTVSQQHLAIHSKQALTSLQFAKYSNLLENVRSVLLTL